MKQLRAFDGIRLKPERAKRPAFRHSFPRRTAVTARSYTAIRAAESRRRRRLAASALDELELQFRGASRHLDEMRMLALGIDPRF
jgi:hypothetical protein